jgi:hypothetical protein
MMKKKSSRLEELVQDKKELKLETLKKMLMLKKKTVPMVFLLKRKEKIKKTIRLSLMVAPDQQERSTLMSKKRIRKMM